MGLLHLRYDDNLQSRQQVWLLLLFSLEQQALFLLKRLWDDFEKNFLTFD